MRAVSGSLLQAGTEATGAGSDALRRPADDATPSPDGYYPCHRPAAKTAPERRENELEPAFGLFDLSVTDERNAHPGSLLQTGQDAGEVSSVVNFGGIDGGDDIARL